ncbi:MAG: O-succinylhomoserine sulfhydrylase, partial [Gammaproteobacteria bacterium]|nr:O-succinylhomoserine sulfhydrylase [Gammaproteobacteria bacterium]
VHYPGLETHPQFELAQRQQSLPGGILSFELAGGKEAAWGVIDSTRMLSITANLGDAKSTITHPATTTHGRLTLEERQQTGISDSLIRLSVGLEELDDIKADLSLGLGC